MWPVSSDFAVAVITAAQADVVIDIEESPIVKAEVSNNALKVGHNIFLLLHLLIDKYSLFASHFAASSRKGEIFSFHRLSTDGIFKNT